MCCRQSGGPRHESRGKRVDRAAAPLHMGKPRRHRSSMGMRRTKKEKSGYRSKRACEPS